MVSSKKMFYILITIIIVSFLCIILFLRKNNFTFRSIIENNNISVPSKLLNTKLDQEEIVRKEIELELTEATIKLKLIELELKNLEAITKNLGREKLLDLRNNLKLTNYKLDDINKALSKIRD